LGAAQVAAKPVVVKRISVGGGSTQSVGNAKFLPAK